MTDSEDTPRFARFGVGRSMRSVVHDAFITGLAIVVPTLVTVLVFAVVANALYGYLGLFTGYIPGSARIPLVPGVVQVQTELLVELLAPLALVVVVLWVGLLVNSSRYGERAVDYFDHVVTRIPGVGSVYESFRQMSDVILDSDARNFREVKLVEFPDRGVYTLGFVTTETPESLTHATEHDEMLTLFLPLAPNPVMGGHLVHMPAGRVHDVDISVEEGLQAIVTSGVALAGDDDGEGLSRNELRRLSAMDPVGRRYDGPDGPADDDAAWHPPAEEATRPRGEREATRSPPADRSPRPDGRDETDAPPDRSERTTESETQAETDSSRDAPEDGR